MNLPERLCFKPLRSIVLVTSFGFPVARLLILMRALMQTTASMLTKRRELQSERWHDTMINDTLNLVQYHNADPDRRVSLKRI